MECGLEEWWLDKYRVRPTEPYMVAGVDAQCGDVLHKCAQLYPRCAQLVQGVQVRLVPL